MKSDDWRIRWQDEYLSNRTYIFSEVETPDHEHCEFCFKKFLKDTHEKAYQTLDSQHVVCSDCFKDFKTDFKFKNFNKDNFIKKAFSKVFISEMSKITNDKSIYRYKGVISLLNNLKEVEFEEERIVLIPCLVTVFIKKPPHIEYIPEKTIDITLTNSDYLIEQLKSLEYLKQGLGSNTFLCFEKA